MTEALLGFLAIFALALLQLRQHLRIGFSLKKVSVLFQLDPDFQVVVNFSIMDKFDMEIGERLGSFFTQSNDGEPSVCQAYVLVQPEPFTIWTPVLCQIPGTDKFGFVYRMALAVNDP